jgi:O-antigen/teichoic acid export membrane protein
MALRMSFGYSADLVQLAGRTRILVWTALANGAVLTAASIPMTYHWGIAGTGLSVAAMVLAGLPVSIWIAKLEVGARFGPALAKSAAALAVVLALGFAARGLAAPRSAFTLVGWSALLTFVYYALALWWQPDLAKSGALLLRRATPGSR